MSRPAIIISALFGLGGVATAGLPSTPVSAAASDLCEESGDLGENAAMTCWYSYGDKYRVCDIDQDDGLMASGWIRWNIPGEDRWWYKAELWDDDDQHCNWNDVDVPEGATIEVNVCAITEDHSETIDCDFDYTVNQN